MQNSFHWLIDHYWKLLWPPSMFSVGSSNQGNDLFLLGTNLSPVDSPHKGSVIYTINDFFNSSPPRQNGRHPIDKKTSLVKMMAWRRIGDKPLSWPTLTQFTDVFYAALGRDELRLAHTSCWTNNQDVSELKHGQMASIKCIWWSKQLRFVHSNSAIPFTSNHITKMYDVVFDNEPIKTGVTQLHSLECKWISQQLTCLLIGKGTDCDVMHREQWSKFIVRKSKWIWINGHVQFKHFTSLTANPNIIYTI